MESLHQRPVGGLSGGDHGAGLVGEVLFAIGGGDVPALREQEGVGHAPANRQGVELSCQIIQEIEFGGNLGAAHHAQDRMDRRAKRRLQGVQLTAHGLARESRQPVCEPLGGGVRAVRRGE